MKTALTIAGSDSSGGAGIQADIKTMMAHGVYAMSAITAMTAQNTVGVRAVVPSPPAFLAAQLAAVFSDIPPDAVKIGMVSSPEQVDVIVEALQEYGTHSIVVDPVMVSTSGSVLSGGEAQRRMWKALFPLATVITPNIPEAETIASCAIETPAAMEKAAESIYADYGCAVLVKGGHGKNTANDLLFTAEGPRWFRGRRIDNPNTHGTGCTLSSAIASNLARGESLEEAVRLAKDYLCGAFEAMLDLGQGSGPLDHGFALHRAVRGADR
jgi:hydroxymethylpyrimidine/phosphomethylpyrimidine kinase